MTYRSPTLYLYLIVITLAFGCATTDNEISTGQVNPDLDLAGTMPANQGAGDSTSTEQTNAGGQTTAVAMAGMVSDDSGIQRTGGTDSRSGGRDASTTTGIAGGQDDVAEGGVPSLGGESGPTGGIINSTTGGQSVGGAPLAGQFNGGQMMMAGGETDVGGMPLSGMPSENQLSVGYCRLQSPASATIEANETVETYGVVFSEGITNQSAGTDVDVRLRAEVGYGPRGSNPDSNAEWAWQSGSPNQGWNDAAEPGNDEYQATLTMPTAGDYDLAYRFSVDDGRTWTYCDRGNGSNDGYAPAQAAQITVRPARVDFCRFQSPGSHTGTAGSSVDVFGIVYELGLTDASPLVDPAPQLQGQAGYGPRGTRPDQGGGWVWIDATGNVNWDGDARGQIDNDEYVANLTLPEVGNYDMAFRFSLNEGEFWLYCDGGPEGSNNGYAPENAARLTVE